MKLSELEIDNLKVGTEAFSIYDDKIITGIVYDDIKADQKCHKWCLVFGSSTQMNERAQTVIEQYYAGRFAKIILCGGKNGINNSALKNTSEAASMQEISLTSGIPKTAIYLDENSQNTFENITNAFHIINSDDSNIQSIAVISSEYHLKRCKLAILKNYPFLHITTIPAYDGYSDKDNWYLGSNEWNGGRCMVIWERNLLTKYAKEEKIQDCYINLPSLDRKL